MSAIEAEAQPTEVERLSPVNRVLLVRGQELEMYQFPDDPERHTIIPNAVAINNPDAFKRLIEDGISGLQDGDDLTVAPGYAGDAFGYEADRFYHITRKGDYFTMRHEQDRGQHQSKPSEKSVEPLDIEKATARTLNLYRRNIFIDTAQRGLGLSERNDRLGEAVRKLGFTSDASDAPIPLPKRVNQGLTTLQEEGINVPNIHFSKDSVIDGDEYIKAWAAGDLPASEQPPYFAHDLLADHFRPLIVFRERAMGVGTLYARAVAELDEITAYKPATDHEGSHEQFEHRTTILKGREKIDHAADCLDNFTSELDTIVHILDKSDDDPVFELAVSGNPPRNRRRAIEMVDTILHSSQRKELLDYLESVGSKAVDPQTGEFSYETYAREMVSEAREFWGITPQQSKPAAQEFMADEGLY